MIEDESWVLTEIQGDSLLFPGILKGQIADLVGRLDQLLECFPLLLTCQLWQQRHLKGGCLYV